MKSPISIPKIPTDKDLSVELLIHALTAQGGEVLDRHRQCLMSGRSVSVRRFINSPEIF
jgi:hypothetical protein